MAGLPYKSRFDFVIARAGKRIKVAVNQKGLQRYEKA
jgi:hypothetical protein